MENPPVGRVYRMSWWFRGFVLFFLLFGGAFLFTCLRDILAGEQRHGIWDLVVAAVFPIVGAILSAKAFTSKIIFSDDSITRRSFWDSRTVRLSLVAGRREYVVNGGEEGGSTRYLRLEFNDGSPPLDFGKRLYRFDDVFWLWFNELPDLDARDAQARKGSNFGLV